MKNFVVRHVVGLSFRTSLNFPVYRPRAPTCVAKTIQYIKILLQHFNFYAVCVIIISGSISVITSDSFIRLKGIKIAALSSVSTL